MRVGPAGRARPKPRPKAKPVRPAGATAGQVDAFLRRHGSPMAGHGAQIVAAARRFKISPWEIVDIAAAETSYGTAGAGPPAAAHNAWGVGGASNLRRFPNWNAAFQYEAKLLGSYARRGMTTPESISGLYVQGRRGAHATGWEKNVRASMRSHGGAWAPAAPGPVGAPYSGVGAPGQPGGGPGRTGRYVTNVRAAPLAPLGVPDFSALQNPVMQAPPQGPLAMPNIPVTLPPYPTYSTSYQPGQRPARGGPRAGGARGGGGFVAAGGYPLSRGGKIIGTPYSGTHTLGNWQSDNAIDIAVPVGTPVLATRNGRIDHIRIHGGSGRFAGDQVTIYGGGNGFFYTHLSRVTVKAGQRVKKGQIIGYSGSANGVAHLHFGMQHGNPQKIYGSGPKRRRR